MGLSLGLAGIVDGGSECTTLSPPSQLRCPWASHLTPDCSLGAAALAAHCSGCVFTAVCVHFGQVKRTGSVTCLPPGECSSLGWMLWKGFSLPWRGCSDHPPLLSSVDVYAFLCCWAHQCIFFSECTKLFICYLSDYFVLILKPNNCLFHLHRELLWPHDVSSEQQFNESIANDCPWNSFWDNCPITYDPLKNKRGTY